MNVRCLCSCSFTVTNAALDWNWTRLLMLASFHAWQWQAGVGTDAHGETPPSWRGQRPSAELMVPRSTTCRDTRAQRPQAAGSNTPMSCGLCESLVALIDLLIGWYVPCVAMSLEEEQLIASSELSLQISHCFMISVICFSMSYMYFGLGTQTKK